MAGIKENMTFVKYDCRHFRGDKPCIPHKNTGVYCEDCPEYDPVTTRILVIKLNAVGDVLRTAGIVPALRSKYTGAYITWVTDPDTVPLLEMVPGIDRIWPHDGFLLERLLTERFDLVLGLDNSGDSAALSYLSRGDKKMGFSLDEAARLKPLSTAADTWFQMGLCDDVKRVNRRTYQDILWDICELAKPTMPAHINVPDSLKIAAKKFAEKYGLLKKKPVIGFFPGAGNRWPQKALSFEKQKELLCKLAEQYQNGVIILFGGPSETKSNRLLVEKVASNVIDAGCNNTLPIFASLINLVDLLITGDTLPLHIALALKKKVVAYFGPTSQWEIDLFGMGEKVIAPGDCIACYKIFCDKPSKCSDLIRIEDIMAAIDSKVHSTLILKSR
jgi:heptosyltransferase-2